MKHNYLKHMFTALLLLCATVATAHDFEVDGIYYNITDATNKTVEVTYKGSYFYEDFDRYTGRVVIPDNVIYNSMTYNVTSIGNNAFSRCTGLVSIEIPNSVISIDNSAFMACTGLKNVTIADGVTSIGIAAFQGCFGLESIEIPVSVTSIGQDAFMGCTEHSRIVVAEENAYYDSRNNCNAIIETATNTLLLGCQSTVIPNSITSIGDNAFYNCAGLKSIEIPASVASIGDMAFYRCTGLTSVTSQIPVDKLFEINSSVFDSVDFNACTLYVPYGAKAKYQATAGWNEFTNIVQASMADGSCGANVNWTFENGVLTITGNGAMDDYSAPFYTPWFNYKNDIKTVVIENGVTNVGNNALTECAYLTDVSLGNSVKSIGAVAFRGCMRLKCIEIPNSVTSIGIEAFHLCPALTSIAIPNSVTSIGDLAFHNCSGLESIVVAEGNAFYDSRNNCNAIIETATNTLLFGCQSTVIPNSVTSIGDNAFYNCAGLESIEIPASVASIGELAFYSCTGLLNVTSQIPADKLFEINSSVFSGVNKTTCTLYVPYGAKETYASTSGWKDFTKTVELDPEVIGGSCGSNVNWTLADGVLTISGNGAMDDYYAWGTPAPWVEYATLITKVVIEDGVTTIGEYAFDACSSLESVEISNSVIKIGESAFSNCPALASVVIPSGVEVFGNAAFYGCTGLRKVINLSATSLSHKFLFAGTNTTCAIYNFPNGEIVGDYVYGETDGVNTLYKYIGNGGDIVLPDSYKGESYVIGDEAFMSCAGLTGVTIPNSVTSIGLWAFYDCENLTEVEIPNSVTVLESGVFAYCENLANVIIPNSVTSIGVLSSMMEGPFEGCISLREVEIPNSVTTIGDCAFNNCAALENIEIPSSVTSIGYCAFNNCTALKSVEIPNSVTVIGDCAFNNCTALESVEIPSSVTSIGYYAFGYCTALESVTSLVPADELFEAYAFDGLDFDACTLYVPYGAKATYASTSGWNYFTNIVELRPSEITITINQYGSGTYCSDFALDFSNVEGLKAYAATGYNVNTGVITLTRLQTAREGTGLFLKGEPGDEYVVPVLEETGDHSLNMLVGTLKETTVNSISSDGLYANYMYTINEGTSTPMFYQFADDSSLSANKAYLQIPLAWLQATASKSVEIRFDDGETTDIDEVEGENGDAKTVYDLQGRVVENPAKGIYIVNGKKVFINK